MQRLERGSRLTRRRSQAHLLVRAQRTPTGTAGMGGAPRDPGRAHPCLPPRARRRRDRRARPAAGMQTLGGDEMTTLTVPARPAEDATLGRCRGGGWPGSPGGNTESRSAAWPRSWARWRCGCGSSAFSCTTPTQPRPPAPGELGCLPEPDHHFNSMNVLLQRRLHSAARARPDRRVHRGAGTGP